MGWSYAHWVGFFYPDGLKPINYLREYAKRLDSVEVNSTFYRIPSKKTVQSWRSDTPENFCFAVKLPRSITHIELGDTEKLGVFIKNVSSLGSKLGPILIQFPPSFKLDELPNLIRFLDNLSKKHRYAVEFRNNEWLSDNIYKLLVDYDVGLVLVEQPWMPEMNDVTADFVYIRLQGDRRKISGNLNQVEVNRSKDTRSWAKKILKFLDSGHDVYVYVSKYYSGNPHEDVNQLKTYLAEYF